MLSIFDFIHAVNKKDNDNSNIDELHAKLVEKEKAANEALKVAEQAAKEAEEVCEQLAAAVSKKEETAPEAGAVTETNAQKIERLKRELSELEQIEKPATLTTKVEAEKLNVTTAPKVEVTTEVYEPEAPKSGVKGAAARRK